jgi:hypothetical protein
MGKLSIFIDTTRVLWYDHSRFELYMTVLSYKHIKLNRREIMKKPGLIIAVIAILAVAGCASSGGGDAPADIGNEWTLDFVRIADASWSDGDMRSMNPPAEVAAAVDNPNGGKDFTITMFNQRIIFGLSRAQIAKVRAATTVDVIIDGESSGSNNFRYHIGDPDTGENWNATASFEPAPFSSILTQTLTIDKSRPERVRALMIQVRGGNTGDPFTQETVTIRSIKFICK